MESGSRSIAIFVSALCAGFLIVVVGLFAAYGSGEFLPLNPPEDRHPSTHDVLMDVRRGFQGYPLAGDRLALVGRKILEKHNLAYLRVETRGGVVIYRSYDPQRISQDQLKRLEKSFEESTPTAEARRSGRYYTMSREVQLLKEEGRTEDAVVRYVYESIRIAQRRARNLYGAPQSVSRWFFLRFEEAAPYIGGAMIALGLALALISLHRLRPRNFHSRTINVETETWPDPDRPLEGGDSAAVDDADIFADEIDLPPAGEPRTRPMPVDALPVHDRPRRKPAAFEAEIENTVREWNDPKNFLFDRPLSSREQQDLRAHLEERAAQPAAEEHYEFEQERWNLPGFQSVLAPIREPVPPDDLDFTTRYFHLRDESRAAGGSSYFDFRFYRYHDQPGFPEDAANVESFAKSFLGAVEDCLGRADITLYLRNRRGRYHAVMRRSGNIFISGAAISEESTVPPKLIQKLGDGNYVALDDGREMFFPVPSREGIPGMLRIRSEAPLYNREALTEAWYEIRKFGELLYQARIFEQATSDGGSTLSNGLMFQRDLLHEFALKREVRIPRALTLLRFHGRTNPESFANLGLMLRAFFPSPWRRYRIAADVFAVLGPEMPAEELERRFGEYLTYAREREAVDLNVGIAVLAEQGGPASAYEWFRRAGTALEQCERLGPNRFRVYEGVGEALAFQMEDRLT